MTKRNKPTTNGNNGHGMKVTNNAAPAGLFINTAGEKFEIHGLSPLLFEELQLAANDEWLQTHSTLPVKPKYSIPLPGGKDVEIHDHDEKTIKDASPEEKMLWEEWKRDNTALETIYNTKLLNAIFMAVKLDPTAVEEWKEEQEVLGVRLPEKGVQMRLKFCRTRVLRSTRDIPRLMTAVMETSGLLSNPEAAAAAENAFQAELEKQANSIPGARAG